MSATDCSITLYDVEVELQESYNRVLDLQKDGNEEQLTDALSILETYITASVQKRDRVGKFLESLDASSSSIECEIERLQERKRRLQKVKQSMEGYILMILGRIGVTKLQGELFTFRSQKNPPKVVIDDELLIPAEFLEPPKPQPPTINKKAIKQAIADKVEVPGARIVQETRLVID